MKMISRVLAATAFALLPLAAIAATMTVPPFTVSEGPSTGITCSAISSSLVAPVAAGTVLASCTVAPSGWTGTVTVSGSTLVASSLTGNTFNLAVGATPLAAGTYSGITVTSAP